jgi:hypothetical protein
MKKITSRDLKLFFLGMLTMLLITLIYDWKEFVRGINDGYKDTRNSMESTK